MAARRVCSAVLAIGLLLAAAVAAVPPHLQLVTDTDGGLSLDFHAASCQQLEGIVRAAVQAERGQDVQVTAGLLRIFFHDCLPQVHTYPPSYSFRYTNLQRKNASVYACM
ncbi:unnamed protein product [Miscanthus lutarioriparius]|uniref:Plant heme peroxidase family profile domain-containing protein n=1 Tax=Miscanthus lutarioriparius TaxID=422564 RepID=A0A811QRX6_9POAL|nr:unnamed protein product [Miscanthus lutarioriparius]